jgi:anti-anti-sigma factor
MVESGQQTEESKMVIRATGADMVVTVRGGEAMTLVFDGSLDALSAPLLRPRLEQALAAVPRTVLFDLTKLRLIDAAGVRTLLALLRGTRARGAAAKVAGAHGQPLALFRLLRADELISGGRAPHAASSVAFQVTAGSDAAAAA